jgi:hypothetical protein
MKTKTTPAQIIVNYNSTNGDFIVSNGSVIKTFRYSHACERLLEKNYLRPRQFAHGYTEKQAEKFLLGLFN